ncbi:hypothetical protein A3197_17535 [Candidatus Thiodiazotropha endoloripes]|nr:hypothetical protein A3197_17535 [Candidatus Thiodiazotropha endoloripes]
MLESKYIEGIDIPPFDKKVTEAIESYPIDGGGKTMVVGVQNLDGDVYRVIQATGMGAYINITSELSSLGLIDELAESIFGQNGFDSLFVVSGELRKSSINATQPKPSLEEIEEEISLLQSLPETEGKSIIQSRLGQGIFRNSLIEYWQGCAVTECEFLPLLKASHIKPWSSSNNQERLDVFNGFLLAPNLDAAFDAGYISFDKKGKIVISPLVTNSNAYSLRITPKLKIKAKKLTERHQDYLEFHRSNVFKNS